MAVAVSGGADSVCLLHVLTQLAGKLGITLDVAHLNHKLRGAESDADAEFVRVLAAQFGLPFHLSEVNLTGNLEQSGREARLSFFGALRVDRVATGHTRSDQAETVIYRLLRGSGTAGLAGIQPVAGRIIRPLIDCTREEVLEYAAANGLTWREDASNHSPAFARNRIRHQLLPALRSEQPNLEEILARTAEVARDEESYWDVEIEHLAGRLVQRNTQGLLLRADEINCLHPAIQRRLLRHTVRSIKGDLRSVDVIDIERIAALVAQREGHGRTQAPGVDVFRSFEWLLITNPRTEDRSARDYCFALSLPGSVSIPRQARILRLEVFENTERECVSEGYNTDSPVSAWVDADRLEDPIEVRNWRPGDGMELAGHSREGVREKIKTLFQAGRVPIWERQGWPVITSNDRIVWTRKFGVDVRFAPVPASRRLIRVVEEDEYSAESNGGDSASLY